MIDEIVSKVKEKGVPVYVGYADSKTKAPYVVVRPITDAQDVTSVGGCAVTWAKHVGLYCVGASVAASYNLAAALADHLSGFYIHGSTLRTEVGYVGNRVEGYYESQVTAHINKGGL